MTPITITPFHITRVVHGVCPVCGAETEIQIGHDVMIDKDGHRTPGPAKAIEECPNCGSAALDPEPYSMPHVH
jgi:YgiT-type zinc finger domain-containing protein